ncbi:hypothetical protein Hdeb2414_s0667g00932831 [Helianthus debilis subsp. tardiflorus]
MQPNILKWIESKTTHKITYFQDKPIMCNLFAYGMSFSFKHVRDNHENPGDMFTCWEILLKLVMNLNKGQGVVCKEIVSHDTLL